MRGPFSTTISTYAREANAHRLTRDTTRSPRPGESRGTAFEALLQRAHGPQCAEFARTITGPALHAQTLWRLRQSRRPTRPLFPLGTERIPFPFAFWAKHDGLFAEAPLKMGVVENACCAGRYHQALLPTSR